MQTRERRPAKGQPGGEQTGQKVYDDRNGSADYLAQLRRRREASRRLPVLECGYADPWLALANQDHGPDLQASRRAWTHLRDLDLLDGDEWLTSLLAEGVAA